MLRIALRESGLGGVVSCSLTRSRFIEALGETHTVAHVALNAAHYTTGLGAGVLGSRAYRASQIVRKRIEQF